MEHKRDNLLLPELTQEPIDHNTFEAFMAAHVDSRETYKDLAPSDEKKRLAPELWEQGKNADLSVDSLDVNDLIIRQNRLRDFKKELISDESLDSDVKQLYRWRINEDIASINMLIASRAGDMRNFRRWNEYIYGQPNEEIYRSALDWVAKDAEQLIAVDDQNPSVLLAANKVVEMLKDKRGDSELIIPSPETFEQVKSDHLRPMGYYGLLLAGVEIPDGKITNEIGDQIITKVVHDNLQSDYELSTASGSSWGVSHSDKSVERPKSYNMPNKRFVGLALGHEIGSHLLEKINGERGPLKLASVGMDRYELGNEGRAVIREEIQFETFDEFGKQVRWRDILRRHIAISYASGIGESEPMSSAEVYAFINTIDTMYQTKLTPDDPEVTKEKAAKKTSDLLTRVLKGTDGTGGAYLKDKVYLEGQVANWLTAAAKGPDAISEGDLGKFDINNPRHIAALQKVGLLPDNG